MAGGMRKMAVYLGLVEDDQDRQESYFEEDEWEYDDEEEWDEDEGEWSYEYVQEPVSTPAGVVKPEKVRLRPRRLISS